VTRRESAKLRPAWVAGREALVDEVAPVTRFISPLPHELLAGFPLLRGLAGVAPWRPQQLLEAVLDAGHLPVVALAFAVRFSAEPEAWRRAASGWPYETRCTLLSSPQLFEVAPLWKTDSLPLGRRQADLQTTWRALMGKPPRASAPAAAQLWLHRAKVLPVDALSTPRSRRAR
jgi:hypothetical protein